MIERIDRAYFILEALPEEDYKRYRAEQEGELVRIEEDIKRLEAVINAQKQVQKGVEFLRQYAENLARSVDELNFFQKQNITRELVQRVKIYADGSLEIEGYFNLPFTGPGKNVPDHCEELTTLTTQKNLKEPLSSSVLTCTHRKKAIQKLLKELSI